MAFKAIHATICIGLFYGNLAFAGPIQLNHNVKVQEISDGVYMATDVDYHESNVLIAKLKDGTVVFASSPFETVGTQTLVDWVKDKLKPTKMVAINTHFHMDGTGGNEAYKKNGVEIWSSDLTKELQAKKSKRLFKASAKDFKNKDLKQRVLNSKIVYADNIFPLKEGKTFDFSGEKVEVFFPGEAHSTDNVVVYLPKQKVLFGGCMIKPETLGYLGDANVKAWAESAKSLKKFQVQYVIRGHGPMGGPEMIDQTIKVAESAAK